MTPDLFSQEWFENLTENLARALKDSPEISFPDAGMEIGQVITDVGDRSISYIIKIGKGSTEIVRTEPADRIPTLITDYFTYEDLLAGKTDISAAIFSGKIKIKGDLQYLISNRQLLKTIGAALANQARP